MLGISSIMVLRGIARCYIILRSNTIQFPGPIPRGIFCTEYGGVAILISALQRPLQRTLSGQFSLPTFLTCVLNLRRVTTSHVAHPRDFSVLTMSDLVFTLPRDVSSS